MLRLPEGNLAGGRRRDDPAALDLSLEVDRARLRLAEWRARGAGELEAARVELTERAAASARW